MGVPSFYRWLSVKYPKVIKDAVEQPEHEIDDPQLEFEKSQNPNEIEFDNLYLDMNGIIHPCCHPEEGSQPDTEEEMMRSIFRYIDRLMNVVRPRRLLYMAIDGVAPRAKMNQQRTRRFKSAAELEEEDATYEKLKEKYEKEGRTVPQKKERWDSNVITPGTPFMSILSQALRTYIEERISCHPLWRDLVVIFSDARSPGEGEHKIMQFIRTQRMEMEWNPNTVHCLHGQDADLIMLALATHEAHFYILREIITDARDIKLTCEECGQEGHSSANCLSGAIEQGKPVLDEVATHRSWWKPMQFLQIPVLREYLRGEFTFNAENFPFKFESERCIDDFIFMCFFVGNDFLPHLPSMSIQKGSIDQLIVLYQNVLPELGDYLSESGKLNEVPVLKFLSYISKVEDEIIRTEFEKAEKRKAKFARNERYQNFRPSSNTECNQQQSHESYTPSSCDNYSRGHREHQYSNQGFSSQHNNYSRGHREHQYSNQGFSSQSNQHGNQIYNFPQPVSNSHVPNLNVNPVGPPPICIHSIGNIPTTNHQPPYYHNHQRQNYNRGTRPYDRPRNCSHFDKPLYSRKRYPQDEHQSRNFPSHQPSRQPTSDWPHVRQPTSDVRQPTSDWPPVRQPTSDWPPVRQPTSDWPPVRQPTSDWPPGGPAVKYVPRSRHRYGDTGGRSPGRDGPTNYVSNRIPDTRRGISTRRGSRDLPPPPPPEVASRANVQQHLKAILLKGEKVDSNDEAARHLKGLLGIPGKSSDRSSHETDRSRKPDNSPYQYQSYTPNQAASARQRDIDLFKKEQSESKKLVNEVKDPDDDVQLGKGSNEVWRPKFYRNKFHLQQFDDVEEFASLVAKHYMRGLRWVLGYYFNGVVSWSWFYPFHYAPFASDLFTYALEFKPEDDKLSGHKWRDFDIATPFKAFEQLMAVLPYRSSHCLPEVCRQEMVSSDSPIRDFYPSKFHEDPDGRRFRWQWVSLLPFIDQDRLRQTVNRLSLKFTDEEKHRNGLGPDNMYFSCSSKLFQSAQIAITQGTKIQIKNSEANGISGYFGDLSTQSVGTQRKSIADGHLFECRAAKIEIMPLLDPDRSHKCELLAGANLPITVLTTRDLSLLQEEDNPATRRYNSTSAKRMILTSLGLRGPIQSNQPNQNQSQNGFM
eukprot:GHVP01012093.1.p1 GENE.GHVP01012093.1~~GHVP01012093.1.p1  ORF type:complete len:1145 (+),score=185.78 GHVP01012093.1:26-3460(+)